MGRPFRWDRAIVSGWRGNRHLPAEDDADPDAPGVAGRQGPITRQPLGEESAATDVSWPASSSLPDKRHPHRQHRHAQLGGDASRG
jgi:hypothetical protein